MTTHAWEGNTSPWSQMLCRPCHRPHKGSAYTAELSLFLQSAPPAVSPLRRQVERLAGYRHRGGRRRCGAGAASTLQSLYPWQSDSLVRTRVRQAFLSLFQPPRPSLSSLPWEQVRFGPSRLLAPRTRAGCPPSRGCFEARTLHAPTRVLTPFLAPGVPAS